MDKKVSIITPCYNSEKFISRYLDSVLNQTYKNIELILIDDGSTDKTKEIIKSYNSQFKKNGMDIKYLYQKNSGQAAALNKGLKVFSGDYITWPDSDDILTNDSIEKKVSFLEKNKDYAYVRTDGMILDEANNKIKGYFAKNNDYKFKENLFLDFIMENNVWFAPGCYMVRTSDFIDVNPKKEIYSGRGGQNWQMILPLAYKYKCGYIDEALYIYVVRNDSHSRNVNTLREQIKRCNEHEEILTNTINNMYINQKEKDKYLHIIKKKYCVKKFSLACSYKNSKLADEYYKEFNKRYGFNIKYLIIYLSVKNKALNMVLNKVKGMRSLL